MKHLLNCTAKAAATLGLMAGLMSPAMAALSGDYALSHWTTTNSNGGNGTVVAGPEAVVLTSSDFSLVDADPAASSLSHAITVAQDTLFSFSWLYRTEDFSSSLDVFGYSIDGAFTQLSADNLSFLETQNGRFSVRVAAGSTFGWTLNSVDSEGGSAVVTLSDLSAVAAVSAVPEPASLALMALGLGTVAALRRRRR